MELKTLFELAKFSAEKYKDTVGFIDEDLSKTYGEFFEDVVFAANKLIKMGFKGKHITLCGVNSYGWLVGYFAASTIGTVLPLGEGIGWDEIKKLCCDVDSDFIIAGEYSELKGADGITVMSWRELLTDRDSTPLTPPDPEDVAVFVPTSGTMGKRRICMLTHKSISADVNGAVATIDFSGNTVATLPFFHSFGILAGIFVCMYNGARIAICSEIHRMYGLFAKESPRFVFLVPAIADAMKNETEKAIAKMVAGGAAKEEAEAKAYANVRNMLGGKCEFAIVGGAPLAPSTEDFFEKTPVRLCSGYGLTECSPAVCVNPPERLKKGSVGVMLKGVEVSILEPDESGCGEIAVKGDIVMKGYYKDPESDAEVFSEHGLLTGDIGRVDEDGYVFITGRKKNTIVLSNGKNVMPEELEAKLTDLPAVVEALVYDGGSVVAAKIYSLSPAECKAQINELNASLPIYKRISRITFVDEPLPRNALKKIIRKKD